MTANGEPAREGEGIEAVSRSQLVLLGGRFAAEPECFSLAGRYGGKRGPRGWAEEGYLGGSL